MIVDREEAIVIVDPGSGIAEAQEIVIVDRVCDRGSCPHPQKTKMSNQGRVREARGLPDLAHACNPIKAEQEHAI